MLVKNRGGGILNTVRNCGKQSSYAVAEELLTRKKF